MVNYSWIVLFWTLIVDVRFCFAQLNLLVTSECKRDDGYREEIQKFGANYQQKFISCDELAEFNSVSNLHSVASQYEIIVLDVFFKSTCRALGIFARHVQRDPAVVFLLGCDEVDNGDSDIISASRLTVISMSVPSWYAGKIFQRIFQQFETDKKFALFFMQSCDRSSAAILQENPTYFTKYSLLSSNGFNSSSEQPVLLCLDSLDLKTFPIAASFLQEHGDLFVQSPMPRSQLEDIVIPSILSNGISDAVAQSDDVLPLRLVYYSAPETAGDSFTTELGKSLFLGNELSRKRLRSVNGTNAVKEEVASVLRHHQQVAKLFFVRGAFVQLFDFAVETIKLSGNQSANFTATLKISVVPKDSNNLLSGYDWRVEHSIDKKDPRTTNELPVFVAIGVSSFLFVTGASILALIIRYRYVKATLSKDRAKFFIDVDDLTPLSRRANSTQLSISSTNNSSKLTNGVNGHGPHGHGDHHVGKSFVSVKTESEVDTELGLAAGENYAKFNGEIVFMRHLRTPNISMKSSMRKLINDMRDLRNDNLNPFVAYFIGNSTPFRPPAVVFEYCSRGSVQDILDKEEIKLDWSFKLSFLSDILRGIKAIHHGALRFHGRLTSRRCVIDKRWTVKITDYGVHRLENIQNSFKSVDDDPMPESLLWTAPEVLRNELLSEGTQKGDIYSFAIIMQELILRARPFGTSELSPKEIIEKIRHPPPLLRPQVPNQSAQPEALMIMKECWAENPEIRPTVDDVISKFKALNQGRKTNIVDSMFQMLEKYSTNLEELIHERTQELNEEKKKTEQLLFRMMPQSVAEKLKLGQPVEPENFSEVTIYFSDIVGFTTISAYSSPMEVVNLLNDLYSMFDTTLSYYDVYKVETIGDAYMVVSGLPIKNGDRHAGEIASVALDLLYQCGKFKIRHLMDVPLLLRIGIHSGSCAAGVVGLTMPRYCLFGDTVNTASRMESTSRAYRIHLSQATHEKLTQVGGFKMEFRGMTFVKGKGELRTYWLEGKEGFNKPLPTPAPDVGDNHGLSEAVIIRGRELQMEHDLKAGLKTVDGLLLDDKHAID